MSYCKSIENMPESEKKALHKRYHDHFYGFPIENDHELFGRLIMEINQAGLSWEIILKKEAEFRNAYDGFSIARISEYGSEDIARLLSNPGIIRNKLKIHAAVYNAQRIILIQKEFGSFRKWLDHHHPLTKPEWVKLFKKNFKFTGGEIVGEFLMSIGLLPGAHDPGCPIYHQLASTS